MSRRQHTTITFQVSVPVPAGWTQKQFIEWFQIQLTQAVGTNVTKVTDKKVTYL